MLTKKDLNTLLYNFSLFAESNDSGVILNTAKDLPSTFLRDYGLEFLPYSTTTIEDEKTNHYPCWECKIDGPFWTVAGSEETWFSPQKSTLCPICAEKAGCFSFETFEQAFVVSDRLNAIVHTPAPYPVLKPSADGQGWIGRPGYRETTLISVLRKVKFAGDALFSVLLFPLIWLFWLLFGMPDKPKIKDMFRVAKNDRYLTLTLLGCILAIVGMILFGLHVAENPLWLG
jgi:hypothetical protein